MFSVTTIAGSCLSPVASLVLSAQHLQLVRSYIERIADVMEAAPEQSQDEGHSPGELKGKIEMSHVSFRYDPDGADVLSDVSFTIHPGQKVAIVGRSGSGK